MKKAIAVVLMVFAMQAPFAIASVDCDGLAELAGTLMQARQNGVPRELVEPAINRLGPVDRVFGMTTLNTAYRQAIRDTDAEKRAIVRQFRAFTLNACRESAK